MATHIRGNGDGPKGENRTYTVRGRGSVKREQLVKEVKDGRHPEHHVYSSGGKDYVRANPDHAEHNNINQD